MEQAKRNTLWWIVLGIVAFFGLSTLIMSIVIYALYNRSAPVKYAASISFQVKGLVTTTSPSAGPTYEDIERTIRRQILRIRSDRVLDAVLKDSEAFRHFCEVNPVSPKTVLRQRLKTSPIPNTDVFEITLRGDNPEEVARQVEALGDAYFDVLHQIETADGSSTLQDLQNEQKALEQKVQERFDSLEKFKASHDITAIVPAYQSKMNTLSNLTTELVKAQSETVAAKGILENLKKQAEAGMTPLAAQEQAQANLRIAQAKEQDLTTRRDRLDRELKDLDKWLVEYKSRNAQLESQQKLLADLSREVTLKQLSSRSDASRIVRYHGTTLPGK